MHLIHEHVEKCIHTYAKLIGANDSGVQRLLLRGKVYDTSDPGAYEKSLDVVHWTFSFFDHHGHFVMGLQICAFLFSSVWPQDVNLVVTEWDACSTLQTSLFQYRYFQYFY